jgi:deazaflavin-dependent oxidoreductase (nitroreductase family)
LKKTSPDSNLKSRNPEAEPYLYLTTRGRKSGQPREIEIWFTAHAGKFYVIAEHRNSQWLMNIAADSSVTVRIAGQSFAAEARAIEAETATSKMIQDLSRRKYGWGDGLVIELTPRHDHH